MAIIKTAGDAINYINTLYETDSDAPTSGTEDFEVWLAMLNVAVNIWENEEGVLWRELYKKLSSAEDGDKTTEEGVTSYDCPTDFSFPADGYVWLGAGTQKTPYKIKHLEEIHLLQTDTSRWCYFITGNAPTLEFNPNIAGEIPDGATISYNYYKQATTLTDETSEFDMSDPMFAVFYVLAELNKEEGDDSSSAIASQKLESMRVKNMSGGWFQDSMDTTSNDIGLGI